MNEYRIQRLKEDLTNAQQRNKHQKQQLANYKKVHEKDLNEIERLNNIINELEKEINERITNIKNYGANFGITIPIEVSNEIDNKLDELNYCLRTLKRLKGDSSNE